MSKPLSDDELSYEPLDEEPVGGDEELTPLDLDALDDEIEPVKRDEETEEMLDTIADLGGDLKPADEVESEAETLLEKSPETESTPAAELAAPEMSVKAESAAELSTAETAAEEKSPLVEAVYRVVIPLTPELEKQVRELRKAGKITEMPPPGIDVVAPFQAEDRAAVEAVLKSWARNHLPLQLEITGVKAQVIGAQQYAAAWTLDPAEELKEAQSDLNRVLAALITPLPDSPIEFPVCVTIGDHVAPRPYPALIGQMQRRFDTVVWDAETVSLIRQTPGSTWETVASFR